MDIEVLINKGFHKVGKLDNLVEKKITFVVVGVARGGTSLLAGVFEKLGIFSGDRSCAPVYEDLKLAEAFEDNNEAEIIKIIEEYNSQYDIWLFKRPASIDYLPLLDKYLRNPVYLVIFKDSFSIANRNCISMNMDLIESLNKAHEDYGKIINFFTTKGDKATGIFFSYDKIIQNRSGFLNYVVELINKDKNISSLNIKKAKSFINPNDESYLDATRITKSEGEIISNKNGYIQGWAKLVHSEEIVKVELLYNDKVIDEILANKKEVVPSKSCGFTFDISTLSIEATKLRVRVKNDIRYLKSSLGAQ